jgi:hypothetical protein
VNPQSPGLAAAAAAAVYFVLVILNLMMNESVKR